MNRTEFTYMKYTTQNRERMDSMIWNMFVAGIIIFISGIFLILIIGKAYKIRSAIGSGFFATVAGIGIILLSTTTDNYTEWRPTGEDAMIQQIAGEQYVVQSENKYEFKVSAYALNGERTEEYKCIQKSENTFVEYVPIRKDETAYYSKFERRNKSILGVGNDIIQTKYVFFIPQK